MNTCKEVARTNCGEFDVVLAKKEITGIKVGYVTWITKKDENNYFAGRYFLNEEDAKKDYIERVNIELYKNAIHQ